MVVHVGPPATRNREPGQARKGAAAAVDVCAGVRLAGAASFHPRPETRGHCAEEDAGEVETGQRRFTYYKPRDPLRRIG